MRKGTVYKTLAGMTAPALLACVICAAPALASEGGHEALRWGDLAWRAINLVIFVAILWHFIGKLCANFFGGRKQKIKEDLDDLNNRRESAKDNLAKIEASIANLDAERQAILDESKKQAEALKQDIIAKAEEQAKQIVEMAKVSAETEGQSIIQDLRAKFADELIQKTQEQLVQALSKTAEQEKLITKSLSKVELQ